MLEDKSLYIKKTSKFQKWLKVIGFISYSKRLFTYIFINFRNFLAFNISFFEKYIMDGIFSLSFTHFHDEEGKG